MALTGGAEGGRLEAGRGCWRFSAAVPAPGRATFKAASAGWMGGNPASPFPPSFLPAFLPAFLPGTETSSWGEEKRPRHLEVPTAGWQRQSLAGWPAKTMGMCSRRLRSSAELASLIPCRASGSGTKEQAAEMLQGLSEPAPPPVLWGTHWCPARHGKDSHPRGRSIWGLLPLLEGPEMDLGCGREGVGQWWRRC